MPSFEEVNFRLRPAKSIERKMMTDVLQKLGHIQKLRDYQYIGFGSTFFSDFRLFHKRLGISDMTSIEKTHDRDERVEFNRPFDCIDIKMQRSDQALPQLDFNKPTVLWLDYETRIKKYMLETDLQQFFMNAPAGSFLFITVNVDPLSKDGIESDTPRVDKLERLIGGDNMLASVDEGDLYDVSGMISSTREIIIEAINQAYLRPRNGGLEDEFNFDQFTLFRYSDKDGPPMMTLGGLLRKDSMIDEIRDAEFDELPFVRTSADPYNIPTPNLTFEEMREADRYLPESLEEAQEEVPAPDEEIEQYESVYRHYPRFVESEL